jgi:DNA-binding response OmpR family regulator
MEADQDLDRAIEAGGDDFLAKPVSFVVLNAKIRAMPGIETMRFKLLDRSHQLTASQQIARASISRHLNHNYGALMAHSPRPPLVLTDY